MHSDHVKYNIRVVDCPECNVKSEEDFRGKMTDKKKNKPESRKCPECGAPNFHTIMCAKCGYWFGTVGPYERGKTK